MPKSIEDIDRQIAALKEQKKRQQAQIAQKKREGLRTCKELIGEEVVNAFNNWISIDLSMQTAPAVWIANLNRRYIDMKKGDPRLPFSVCFTSSGRYRSDNDYRHFCYFVKNS